MVLVQFIIILHCRELELYNPDLLRKPAICLINKMDSDGAREAFEEIKIRLSNSTLDDPGSGLEDLDESQWPETRLDFVDVIPMSAKFSPSSVQTVKDRLRKVLDELRETESSVQQLGTEEAEKKLDLMLSDTSTKLT